MDLVRQRVHVEVKGLGLSWVRPGRLIFSEQKKEILNNITFSCPPGQITAIMVSIDANPKMSWTNNFPLGTIWRWKVISLAVNGR